MISLIKALFIFLNVISRLIQYDFSISKELCMHSRISLIIYNFVRIFLLEFLLIFIFKSFLTPKF